MILNLQYHSHSDSIYNMYRNTLFSMPIHVLQYVQKIKCVPTTQPEKHMFLLQLSTRTEKHMTCPNDSQKIIYSCLVYTEKCMSLRHRQKDRFSGLSILNCAFVLLEEKKNLRFARPKKKYSNSCVVRKKNSERNKKP
jgi:hypothetical protein